MYLQVGGNTQFNEVIFEITAGTGNSAKIWRELGRLSPKAYWRD